MSKTSSKNSGKVDNRDHKRESSGGRNDKSHSKSDSSSKNSLKQDEKDPESMLASEANSKDKDGDSKAAEEKKFTGRCRLFVGNLTPDVTEDDFKKMFEPYGEISEVYVNTGRGFGFIRLVRNLNFIVIIFQVYRHLASSVPVERGTGAGEVS